jgi:hypothetical protein
MQLLRNFNQRGCWEIAENRIISVVLADMAKWRAAGARRRNLRPSAPEKMQRRTRAAAVIIPFANEPHID